LFPLLNKFAFVISLRECKPQELMAMHRRESLAPFPDGSNKKSNEMKDVLTFNEAAEYTGLSKSYLYKLTSTQQIPHYKPMGKCLFFNRLELEAFLQQNRVNTVDEISSQAMAYCVSNGKGGKK